MSNSSLVSYKKISPHKTTPRNHKIDTITIHCAVGQLSVQSLGNIFSGERAVSSNYGIGFDGKIGMYVEEKDRSFCSSNAANDHRAITIECASGTKHPYTINQQVYDALIELCVDICKRNKIKELKWKGDKSLIGKVDQQNMTVHRWFANKSCPGEYIYSRLGKIAAEVNAKLNEEAKITTKKPETTKVTYKVQVGAFGSKANADALCAKVKASGFTPAIIKVGILYKVVVGSYAKESSAENLRKKLSKAGYTGVITTQTGTAVVISKLKSVDTIAKEVLEGKWGNGKDRKTRLEKAGYDYEAVQKRVNELL